MLQYFPKEGFVRLWEVLKVLPLGKTSWYKGIKAGIYPRPVKISSRCVAWKADEIRALLRRLAEQNSKTTVSPKDCSKANEFVR